MTVIGSIQLKSPLILAPLAGYSDLPFRLLCREYGAGLAVSEMISCHGLIHQQSRTREMLASRPEDRPVSFQLFGADAAAMGEAAAIISSCAPDIIDINMGCPVKKVTQRGAGAALMTNLALAETILRAVVANSTCPVTIKIRSGPDRQTINAVEFARMAEANGAAAITVHPRTWSQAFSGTADWQLIRQVSQSVAIPVIGNGDISSRAQALQHRAEYGCQAVMIGRAALGNPWVFSSSGRPDQAAPVALGALRHVELLEECYLEPAYRLAAMKNHLGRYFRGFPGSSVLRRQIYESAGWEPLKELLLTVAGGLTLPPEADTAAASTCR